MICTTIRNWLHRCTRGPCSRVTPRSTSRLISWWTRPNWLRFSQATNPFVPWLTSELLRCLLKLWRTRTISLWVLQFLRLIQYSCARLWLALALGSQACTNLAPLSYLPLQTRSLLQWTPALAERRETEQLSEQVNLCHSLSVWPPLLLKQDWPFSQKEMAFAVSKLQMI